MKKLLFAVIMAVCLFAQAASAEPVAVTKAITAENTYTASISPYNPYVYAPKAGSLGIFISGTFVATVSLQYSLDKGASWNNLYVNGTQKTYTAPTHDTLIDYEYGILYRIGVATGAFTSGTVNVRLSK